MKKQTHSVPGHTPWFPDEVTTNFHQCLAKDFLFDEALSAESLYLGHDTQAVSSFRQVAEFKKKYKSASSDQKLLDSLGKEKLMKLVSVLKDFQLALPGEYRGPSPLSERDRRTVILLRAREIVRSIIGEGLEFHEWFEACSHGVGTTIGTSFARCGLRDKFCGPMTVTQEALPFLRLYQQWDYHFERALSADPRRGGAIFRVVEGSRLTTVDKDDRARRTIAIEPTGNMFLQQGLMRVLYKRLRPYLDFTKLPDKHRQLARQASVDLQNATIDWSSASDTVLLELVEWLLPSCWFSALNSVRCKRGSLDGGRTYFDLPMISTMGNATTFPVESIVFYSIAVACLEPGLSLLVNYEDLKRVSVFGDDCILPSPNAEEYIDVMKTLGFIPNVEKSFYGVEHFRESCGGDYFHGCDVRPYNIKAPRTSKRSSLEPWLYTVGNGLLKKYRTYFGDPIQIRNTHGVNYLLSLFNEFGINVKVVPDSFPDDSGLKIWQEEHLYDGVTFEPIRQDRHGSYTFLILQFKYWESYEDYSEAAYWSWLKARNSFDPSADPIAWVRELDWVCGISRGSSRLSRRAIQFLAKLRMNLDVLLAEEESVKRRYQVRDRGGYVVTRVKQYLP